MSFTVYQNKITINRHLYLNCMMFLRLRTKFYQSMNWFGLAVRR